MLLVEFLPTLGRKKARPSRRDLSNRGSWRRNRRPTGADMFINGVSDERCLRRRWGRHGRIAGDEQSYRHGACRAARPILLRFRDLVRAIMQRFIHHLHHCAAVCRRWLRQGRLQTHRAGLQRGGEHEQDEDPDENSHRLNHTPGGRSEARSPVGKTAAWRVPEAGYSGFQSAPFR